MSDDLKCESNQEPTTSDKLEFWKQAINTQMHFNDLCVRSRQLGLTFVVAALGLSVVLLSNYSDAKIEVFSFNIHVAAFLMFICVIAVFAVWILDLGVYHKMLQGSVSFVEEMDKAGFSSPYSGIPYGMTQFISAYSRNKRPPLKNGRLSLVTDTSARGKVRNFYILICAVLILIGVLIAVTV